MLRGGGGGGVRRGRSRDVVGGGGKRYGGRLGGMVRDGSCREREMGRGEGEGWDIQ